MSETREKVVSTLPKDESREKAIIAQAKKRARDGVAYYTENFKQGKDDLRMLAGFDHWPASVEKERKADNRPVITVNKLPAFTDQIINDSRLNQISIMVKPNGGDTTKEMADLFNGIIRNIENASDADTAYQTASDNAVYNGFGYFRIITSFTEDSPWDQEIFIRRIRNPFTVIPDPNHTEFDGRDALWYLITEMVPREDYKARWPGLEIVSFEDSGADDSYWYEEDRVRVAEYWVKEPFVRKVYLLSDGRTVEAEDWDKIADDLKANEKIVHLEPSPPQAPQGQPIPAEGAMGPEGQPPMPSGPPQGQPIVVEGPAPEGSGYPEQVINPTPTIIRTRKIQSHKVMQYLIDGEKIIESTEWPGKYIPIIPVWGKEITIGEERHLRGAIRFAKDPQRLYNYFRTASAETVALAPKAPYIAEERQIADHSDEWGKVNRKNLPYLLYKHVDGVPMPSRQVVTQTALGEITETNIAGNEMKETTSLHNASLGMQGNEVSGVAIGKRQMADDTANYVFHKNKEKARKFAGEILVDLIPKVYDSERQIIIIDELDNEQTVTINQVVRNMATGEDVIINDLSMGRYKVTASSGPSFETQREQAANSMMDFVRTAPDAARFVMDLIADNMNWPGSKKIANRLKKMLLPEGIDEDGPMPPKPPSKEDMFLEEKIKGTRLGNKKKQLDVVEKTRELTDEEAVKGNKVLNILKAQTARLNNMQKKLDIIEQKRRITGEDGSQANE